MDDHSTPKSQARLNMDSKTDQAGVVVAPLPQSNVTGSKDANVHYARRGGDIVDSDVDSTDIQGYDAERMRTRTLSTGDEEKKLLRRIDWHIMPLCSLMFLLKNMDYDNVSHARIMNDGTPRNIMTELGLSSDTYALLTIAYHVRLLSESAATRC